MRSWICAIAFFLSVLSGQVAAADTNDVIAVWHESNSGSGPYEHGITIEAKRLSVVFYENKERARQCRLETSVTDEIRTLAQNLSNAETVTIERNEICKMDGPATELHVSDFTSPKRLRLVYTGLHCYATHLVYPKELGQLEKAQRLARIFKSINDGTLPCRSLR